jgi:hypothetical protein
VKGLAIGDDDDLILLAGFLPHFQCHGDAADASSQNYDTSHWVFLFADIGIVLFLL